MKKIIIVIERSADLFDAYSDNCDGIYGAGNKYFIVLGKTSDGKLIGFVVINSQINKNLSEPLQRLHYPLFASKYTFLQKNRFADCGELKEITLDNFTDRYKCRSFGKIDEDDLQLITEAVKTSPKETKKHLRKFGLIE